MASDSNPEEELPPRLRFERMVKGPEPHIFRSVRSESDPLPEDEDEADASPESEDEPAGDSTILDGFDALKRSLGSELEPSPPADAVPSAPAFVDRDFIEGIPWDERRGVSCHLLERLSPF